jgi:hypothetical protein
MTMSRTHKSFAFRAAIFLSLLAAAAVSNAVPVADLAGWSNTRWGMSLDDLIKVRPEMTLGNDIYGFSVGRLPDVMIENVPFRVFLRFEGTLGQRKGKSAEPELPKSKWRLNEVDLIGPVDACDHVTETLIAKYGQATRQNQTGFHLWVLSTTTVRQIVSSECRIIYQPTDKNNDL